MNLTNQDQLLRLFLSHISDPHTPLYTIEELRDKIEKFIYFLETHKNEIIDTGSTRHNFNESLWMDLRLKSLYNFEAEQNILLYDAKSNKTQIKQSSELHVQHIYPVLDANLKDLIKHHRQLIFFLKQTVLYDLTKDVIWDYDSNLSERLKRGITLITYELFDSTEKLFRSHIQNHLRKKSSNVFQYYTGGIDDILYIYRYVQKENEIQTYSGLKKELLDKKLTLKNLSANNPADYKLLGELFRKYIKRQISEDLFWDSNYKFRTRFILDIIDPNREEIKFSISPSTPEQARLDRAKTILFPADRNTKDYLTSLVKIAEEMERFSGEPIIVQISPETENEFTSEDKKGISGNFKHSSDFRSVFYRGKIYGLTSYQARVVCTLYENFLNNTPDLGQAHILEEIDVPYTSRLRDIFRNSDTWGTLVVPGETKGTYRLNLES